jgi:hypothetical protein
LQSRLETFETAEPKSVNLRRRILPQSVEHVSKCLAQGAILDELVLHQRAKQYAGDVQLLVRVLGKKRYSSYKFRIMHP